jgi:hypothetical protein
VSRLIRNEVARILRIKWESLLSTFILRILAQAVLVFRIISANAAPERNSLFLVFPKEMKTSYFLRGQTRNQANAVHLNFECSPRKKFAHKASYGGKREIKRTIIHLSSKRKSKKKRIYRDSHRNRRARYYKLKCVLSQTLLFFHRTTLHPFVSVRAIIFGDYFLSYNRS